MPRRRSSIAWACTASPSSTTASAPPSSTRRSARPAGASCGRRRTTGHRGRRRSRSPSSPRSSAGASPTPPFSARPWRRSSAAGPGRRPPPEPETVALTADLVQPATAENGRVPPGAVAIDAHAAAAALVLEGAAHGYTIGTAALAGEAVGIDLTRPTATLAHAGGRHRGRRAVPIAPSRRRGDVAQPRSRRDECGPRRRDARRADADVRLRPRPPPVRRGHRILSGGPAPAGRRLRRHGGLPEHRAPRRLGGRRAAGPRRAGRGVGRQGLLRPGGALGVRDGHSGARWHRQHLGLPGPRLPAPGAAVGRRARWRGAQPRPGARRPRHRRRPMDFADSPEELAFRLRLREWLGRNNPGLPAVVDGRRVLGRAGRLAPDALRRRLLRLVLADRGRRARPAQRLRGDPRRGADHRRHAAAAERGVPGPGDPAGTATRTSSAASCPGW